MPRIDQYHSDCASAVLQATSSKKPFSIASCWMACQETLYAVHCSLPVLLRERLSNSVNSILAGYGHVFETCVCVLPAAGNRFFFVGQQSSIPDSTESSDSSNLSTNLASQTGITQQAALSSFSPQPAVSCSLLSCFSHHHQFMSQSQLQALPATLPRTESSSASPERLTWLCPGSSPQLGSASLSQSAAAASDELQGFASESCMGSMPLFPVFETMGLSDENDMWAAECPPEDVDQLLDWATNSSLSDPTAESPQLEMPSELNPRSFESGSHSVQTAARQLSSNLGSSSLLCEDLRAQSAPQTCLADLSTQSAEMSYSDLPAVEAYAEACTHPSATFLADDDSLDVDPLELLMQREEASHLETMTCSADAMLTLSGRDSSHSRADVQQAGTHDQTDTQKKRCGRPRVYDLDRPVDTGKTSSWHCIQPATQSAEISDSQETHTFCLSGGTCERISNTNPV